MAAAIVGVGLGGGELLVGGVQVGDAAFEPLFAGFIDITGHP